MTISLPKHCLHHSSLNYILYLDSARISCEENINTHGEEECYNLEPRGTVSMDHKGPRVGQEYMSLNQGQVSLSLDKGQRTIELLIYSTWTETPSVDCTETEGELSIFYIHEEHILTHTVD